MTSTSSDPLAMYALRSERVTLAGLLSVGRGEADSRSLALPAVRHSSMTRKALKALARVHQSVTESSPSLEDMSDRLSGRLSHHY